MGRIELNAKPSELEKIGDNVCVKSKFHGKNLKFLNFTGYMPGTNKLLYDPYISTWQLPCNYYSLYLISDFNPSAMFAFELMTLVKVYFLQNLRSIFIQLL